MSELSPEQQSGLDVALIAHREAMIPLAGVQWRAGRTLGTTVYARTGGGDWKSDTWIASFATRELAARAISDHNAGLP